MERPTPWEREIQDDVYRQFKSNNNNSIHYLWKFTHSDMNEEDREGVQEWRLRRCTGQEYREGSSSIYDIPFLKVITANVTKCRHIKFGYWLSMCLFVSTLHNKTYLPKMVSLFTFPLKHANLILISS